MKVFITFTFVLYFCFQPDPVFGSPQKQFKDILSAKPDTSKVKALSDLCWDYRFVSADSAILFGESALKLAQELNYDQGIAQAYNDLGIIFIDQGHYRQAQKYLHESMKIREQLNDQSGIASLHNKLGIIDQKQGRLKDALEHQLSALKIYQQLQQDKWIGYCLNNIAIIHQNLGNFGKALEYHQKALSYRVKLNDQLGEATSYANMANLHARIKDTLLAINYYEKSLDLSRRLKNEELISGNLSNMSNIYLARRDYEKALNMFSESLQIRERLGDTKGISSTLSRIGAVYTETRQYDKAAKALTRSIKIAQDISVIEEELSALLGLAKLKALTNDLNGSFSLMSRYIAAKDSVYDARIKQQIFDVQSQYETDQLEQDLELVKKEKEFTEIKLSQRKTEVWLLVFVFISLSGAGIFLFYRHQARQKAALTAERFREQEIRMKAVFQAQEEERYRIAKELHDGVGQTIGAIKMNYGYLHQKVGAGTLNTEFDVLEKMLDHASSEVRNISHQMLPRELDQFGLIPAVENMLSLSLGKSSVKYNFEHSGFTERISKQIELVLFRVLQELVSNVIKHAFATKLEVQLIKLSSHLVLAVTDNGKGFELGTSEKTGLGLLNIASRIDSIKGNLHFESNIGKGTSITIRTPLS